MRTPARMGITIGLTLILTFPVTFVSGAKPSPRVTVTTEQPLRGEHHLFSTGHKNAAVINGALQARLGQNKQSIGKR